MLNPDHHQMGRLRLRKDLVTGSSGQGVGSRARAHSPHFEDPQAKVMV